MKKLILSLSAIALFQSTAYAAGMGEDGRIHVSGGIAMPSAETSVHTNPAGLTNAHTGFVLQAGAPDVWENGRYRAGLQTGNSSFGAAGGVEYVDSSGSDALIAYYGLGVKVDSASFGIAARTGISNSSGTSINLGSRFKVGSSATMGVTAWGVNDGVSEWGLGAAFNLSSGIDFVIDAAADDDFKNIGFKPGLKIGNGSAALTVSYGTKARQQFAADFTAGVSLGIGSASQLEVQYNAGGALNKYYAALVLPL